MARGYREDDRALRNRVAELEEELARREREGKIDNALLRAENERLRSKIVDADGLSEKGRAVHDRQNFIARVVGTLSVLLGLGSIAFGVYMAATVGYRLRAALLLFGLGAGLVLWGAIRIARGRDADHSMF